MARTKRLKAKQLSALENIKKDKERSVDVISKILQALIIGLALTVPTLLATNNVAFAVTLSIVGFLVIFSAKEYREQINNFNKANTDYLQIANR
jgi:hypothetical protein